MAWVLPTNVEMPPVHHSCANKMAYTTRSRAQRSQGLLASKYPGVKFEVYRCEHCSHWHVGKNRAQWRKLREGGAA